MAQPGSADGIVVGEEVALHVTAGEQTLDRALFRVEHAQLIVHIQPSGNDQQFGRHLRSVERSFRNRLQAGRIFAEVFVDAEVDELVVASDRRHKRIGRNIDRCRELFEGLVSSFPP